MWPGPLRLRDSVLELYGSSREVEETLPSAATEDETFGGGERELDGVRVVRSWEEVLERMAGIVVVPVWKACEM